MIEIVEGLPRNVVGIAVKGRVTLQDCRDVLAPAIERSLRRHEKIRLYYEIGSRFPGAAWDDLDLGVEHASRCERVAIVTDCAWVRLAVKTIRFLIPSEIRVFAATQAEEGRAWIIARPRPRSSDEEFPSSAAPLRPLGRTRRPATIPASAAGNRAAARLAS
jgi:hypothetical protein